MATEVTLDHKNRRIIFRSIGKVTGEEVLSATQEAHEGSAFESYDQLVDGTAVQFLDVSYQHLREVAKLDSVHAAGARIAIVGASWRLFGMDILYEFFIDLFGNAVEIGRFDTVYDAEKWLNLNLETPPL